MKLLAFVLLLSPRLFAQSVPSPEQASVQVSKLLQESFGSYQQALKERQRRDLMPRPGTAPDGGTRFNLGRNAVMDPMYRQSLRFESDSVDINLLRPSSRVTLGVGYADKTMSDHGRVMRDEQQKYGFIRFQLGGSKDAKKSRIIWPPTSTVTETELGPGKVRVDREEFTRGLKDLKP